MTKNALTVAVIALIFAGCGSREVKPASAPKLVSLNQDEMAIYEAVLRYELGNWPEGERTHCFLSLGWNRATNPIAPPDELIKRLDDLALPVHSPSECEFITWTSKGGTTVRTGVRDKTTGERGLIQMVEIVEWVNDGEVVIRVSHWSGPLAGGGYGVTVKKSNGRWSVDEKSTRGYWIS